MNLLTNAIKYSPRGATVKVMVKTVGRKAYVSVRDYGVGIPVDQQKKIFERFYRVANASAQTTPGLGIGLYLSSMIIKHHGGSIAVKSREQRGSTFSFTLPLSVA
jgi:signal transduction histidine kinase